MIFKPTINDAPSEAAVSHGAVSKMLGRRCRRERFARVCSRSLWAVELSAQGIAASLRNRLTHTIGIIVPDILNTFYATLVERLETLASAGGYTVIVVETTPEEPQRALERIDVIEER
jgi:DNA-binding LacI/PurR family transcriptional regulator